MPHTFGPFSLDPPPGWTLSTIVLAGPADDTPPAPGLRAMKTARTFQRNIVVTMEQVAEGETPQAYVDRQLDGLRRAGVKRWETYDPEPVKLAAGSLDGLLTQHVIEGSDGERVHQMQLVCIRDGLAYTLIASHLDGPPFQKAREEFRQILLSFQ